MSDEKAKENDLQEDEGDEPIKPAFIFENMPERERTVVEMAFAYIQMTKKDAPESSISKQFTSEHMTTYLESARENMQQEYKEKRERKIFIFAITLVALVFIIVLSIVLGDKTDVLEKIVIAAISFVAGAGGGFGYSKWKSSE